MCTHVRTGVRLATRLFMLIRVNYASEFSQHLKWHISNNIYNDADMLKGTGPG